MTDFKETNNLQSKIKKMKKELDRMNMNCNKENEYS
jgi:hypothetical protein